MAGRVAFVKACARQAGRNSGGSLRATAIVLALQTWLGVALLPPSAAAQVVKGTVSATVDNGFARLIFSLGPDIESQARLANNVVVISFNRPVEVNIDHLRDGAAEYISAVRRDPDGKAVRIALAKHVTLNSMLAGERLYVDLLPEGWSGLSPGLPREVIEELARRARDAEKKLRQEHQVERDRTRALIRVRVATQPTFTRYVFQLPEPISVAADNRKDALTLTFNAPLSFDLADAKAALPATLQSIDSEADQDTAVVRFAFKGSVDVRTFREDNNYVADVGSTEAKGPLDGKPAAELAALAADLMVKKMPAPGSMEAPQTVPAKAAGAGAPSAPAPSNAAPRRMPAPVPVRAATPPAPAAASASESVPAPMAAAPAQPQATPAPPPNAPPTPPMTAAPEPPAAPMAGASPAQDEATPLDPSSSIKVALQKQGENVSLRFPFASATPAAVFLRADVLWIVFDTNVDIALAELANDGGRTLKSATATRQQDAAVVRIKLERPRLIGVATEGSTWVVNIGSQITDPIRALTVSHGTALLDQVIVDRGPDNNDGIFVQVEGLGGNGGRSHAGGDGAPGEPDAAGTVTTDTSHSFDSGFSDITVTTELGSLQGLAGSGGAGGAGGTGTAIIQNSSFTASGANPITIEDFAEGGAAGTAGNGGAGGAGIFSDGSRVNGFGGDGGAGGRGGDATAIVLNDTIAGTGDDNISVMVTAAGVTGGNGGNGGAGSDDHKTDINQVIVQTVSQDGTLTLDKLHSSTQVITDTDIFGTGGNGGAGGNGGNAVAELLNNDIHVDGSGNIAIQFEASGGLGGQGGIGAKAGADGATGASEIDMIGNSIHGGSGPGTISITAHQFLTNPVFNFSNNDIETGTTTETIQLVVSNLPLAAVNGSGNHFVGNGANETLDLSGWDRAIDIDFGSGNIKLDAAAGMVSGTISGFANVIGTGHADSFENLSGNISVTGGNAADHFGLASNVLSSTIIPSIADFHPNNESIDISSLLNTVFGGNNPSSAGNFVEVKEDASGTSATLMINQSGTPGGTFVAAAHLGGVHTGDVVTAVLDHAQHTAQLTTH